MRPWRVNFNWVSDDPKVVTFTLTDGSDKPESIAVEMSEGDLVELATCALSHAATVRMRRLA